MTATIKKLQVGKEVLDLDSSINTKHAITIPAKKTKPIRKLTFDEPNGKLTKRQARLRKMAEKYIQQEFEQSVTRRSKAVKIYRLKDGRRVYIKKNMNQTRDSMPLQSTRPETCALKDRKAMMFMVKNMKIEHRNKLKKEQMTKAGKADKFKPIPFDSGRKLSVIVKKFYGPEPIEKTAVRITNLPESANEKTLDIALGRYRKYVKKLTVTDSVSKKDEAAGKKMKFAMIETGSEDSAKAILRHRSGKIKMSGKLAKLRVVKPSYEKKKTERTEEEKKASKEKAAKEKARKLAIRKGNHERHMKNLKDAKRKSNSRRHPKYAAAKFIRDKKTGRLYAIKRNPEAKAPKIERRPVNRYKTLRAMVRATRK